MLSDIQDGLKVDCVGNSFYSALDHVPTWIKGTPLIQVMEKKGFSFKGTPNLHKIIEHALQFL